LVHHDGYEEKTMTQGLTTKQREILDFIRMRIREQSYPPTVREIGEALGLSSSSTVHSHIAALEAKGYLKRNGSSARALTVVEDGTLEEDGTPAVDEEIYRNMVALPLLGRVAAGAPILAEQNIEETLPLPRQIVGDSSSFLLEVKGESMIDIGICDGDYVVVKEARDARNGDIVVALVDDSATVKTFYREAGHIRLQPENSTMEPIIVDDCMVLGTVTALFRTFR
jgi:repressor LexA